MSEHQRAILAAQEEYRALCLDAEGEYTSSMLCYAVLCYTVLNYAMLYCAILC